MRPATPYVAEFTRDVPKAKVLTVAAIMAPDATPPAEGEVRADARIAVGRGAAPRGDGAARRRRRRGAAGRHAHPRRRRRRDARGVRVATARHPFGLRTPPPPLIPAQAGIQLSTDACAESRSAGFCSPFARRRPFKSWVPACAGMSGGGDRVDGEGARMTVAASIAPGASHADGRTVAIRIAWAVVIAVTAILFVAGGEIAPWAVVYPKGLEVPAAKWISAGMNWLVDDATFGLFTFTELTRAISAVVEVPYTVALSVLSTGFLRGEGSNAVQLLPPLSWIAVIAIVDADRPPCRRPAARHPRRPLLPLPRRLRPVAERDADARLDPGGGAGRRRRRPAPRPRRLPLAGLRAGDAPGPRPDADGADLRLSGADPLPLRLRAGRLDRRHHHLRHAADGAGHHPRAAGRARRGQGPRPDDRLHAAADDLEGDGAVGPARADGRRQPGDHAVAQHGDHRLDDRRRRPRLRRARRAPPARHRRRHRSRGSRSSCSPSPSTGFPRPLPRTARCGRGPRRHGRGSRSTAGTPT